MRQGLNIRPFNTDTPLIPLHLAKTPWPQGCLLKIWKRLSRVPGVDLASGSVNMVLDIIALGREVEIAGLVRNPAKYADNNKMAVRQCRQMV